MIKFLMGLFRGLTWSADSKVDSGAVNEKLRAKVEDALKKGIERGERIRPPWQARTWIEYQTGWYTTPVKGQEEAYVANRENPVASLLAWQKGFRLSKATLSDHLVVERWKDWGHGWHWAKDESFLAQTSRELVEEINQREEMQKERRRTENDEILRRLRRS